MTNELNITKEKTVQNELANKTGMASKTTLDNLSALYQRSYLNRILLADYLPKEVEYNFTPASNILMIVTPNRTYRAYEGHSMLEVYHQTRAGAKEYFKLEYKGDEPILDLEYANFVHETRLDLFGKRPTPWRKKLDVNLPLINWGIGIDAKFDIPGPWIKREMNPIKIRLTREDRKKYSLRDHGTLKPNEIDALNEITRIRKVFDEAIMQNNYRRPY